MFEIAAVCLVLTALLAHLNERFIGLPIAIGVMAAALLLSLALIGLDLAGIDFGLRQYEESLLRSIDFSTVLMQGMLSLLLFAGALHVDLSELRAYRWQVALLAVLSTCCPRWRWASGPGSRCPGSGWNCRWCSACCSAP